MKKINQSIMYAVLLIFGFFMIVPFLWMLSTSAKTQTEANKPKINLLPYDELDFYSENGIKHKIKIVKDEGEFSIIHIFDDDNNIVKSFQKVPSNKLSHEKKLTFHWENYKTAFSKVPFGRYFFNSIFVAFLVTIGVLITSSLAAYSFARMTFWGKDKLFSGMMGMMMVPQPIYLIPSYVLLNYLGWIDTYMALIVPWLASVFSIFLLIQHFKTIPQELFDAAKIDGCSDLEILWRIVLPLSSSVLVTAGIMSIISSWNSFMWPLIMTNSDELRVLQVGLSYFAQESSSQTTLLMAASTFSLLPLIILFLFAQKRIIASYASSGLKG